MPNLGYETAGASTFTLEAWAAGYPATMTENGTLDSVTAYCREDTGDGNHTCRAGVYNASDGLEEESGTATPYTTTASWQTFNMAGTVNLTDTVEYRMMVGAGNGAGSLGPVVWSQTIPRAIGSDGSAARRSIHSRAL